VIPPWLPPFWTVIGREGSLPNYIYSIAQFRTVVKREFFQTVGIFFLTLGSECVILWVRGVPLCDRVVGGQGLRHSSR